MKAAGGTEHLVEFRLELGLPVWTYEIGGTTIEKRVIMPHGQNTVHLRYRLLAGGPVRLLLRPSIQFRSYEAPVTQPAAQSYSFNAAGARYEISGGPELPCLRMLIHGERAALTLDERQMLTVPYETERSRGYEAVGSLWSPGYFRAHLISERHHARGVERAVGTRFLALGPADAERAEHERRRKLLVIGRSVVEDRLAAELVLAADQFIIAPADASRRRRARARGEGQEVPHRDRGYHWFTDWGRDTMISLEGLTPTTGRIARPRIPQTFGHYVRAKV